MSKMSNLDAELRAAGIDPEEVDLEAVEAYRAGQLKHGRLLTVARASVEMLENEMLTTGYI
jgi:hypothetical protein